MDESGVFACGTHSRHGDHPTRVCVYVKLPYPLAELLKEGILDSPIILLMAT